MTGRERKAQCIEELYDVLEAYVGGNQVGSRPIRLAADAVMEHVDKLEAALRVYADARHWGIQRDEFRHPHCVWLGPGATDHVPDGPAVAREALRAVRSS